MYAILPTRHAWYLPCHCISVFHFVGFSISRNWKENNHVNNQQHLENKTNVRSHSLRFIGIKITVKCSVRPLNKVEMSFCYYFILLLKHFVHKHVTAKKNQPQTDKKSEIYWKLKSNTKPSNNIKRHNGDISLPFHHIKRADNAFAESKMMRTDLPWK